MTWDEARAVMEAGGRVRKRGWPHGTYVVMGMLGAECHVGGEYWAPWNSELGCLLDGMEPDWEEVR